MARASRARGSSLTFGEKMGTRDEMNTVSHTAFDLAVELLEKNGCVSPFAVVMLASGEIRLVALDEEERGSGAPLDRIQDILRAGAKDGLYRAVAICSDVRVKRFEGGVTDALRVEAEHVADIPITSFIPYRREAEAFCYQDGYMEPGKRQILEGASS